MRFFRLGRNFYQWSKKASPFKTKGRTGKRISTCSAELKREKLLVGLGVEVANARG